MGSQNNRLFYDEDHFVLPKKIERLKQNKVPLEDVSNKIEQIFGISNIPVSHRAEKGSNQQMDITYSGIRSFHDLENEQEKNKDYQFKITDLQQQIHHLKSIIEEEKYRTRKNSPVKTEIENDSSGQIKEFQSRLRKTYFRTKSENNHFV